MGIYAKISVDLPKDKRIRRVGPLAELLYIRCILLSKELQSDGEIDASQLALAAVGIKGRVELYAAKLVEEGLWEETFDGWRIPADKWAKWQVTAKEVEEIKQKRSQSGAKGAAKRWQNDGKTMAGLPSDEMANAINTPMANACTDFRHQTSDIIPPNPPAGGVSVLPSVSDPEFEEFASAYPKVNGVSVGVEQCRVLFARHDADDRKRIISAAGRYAKVCRDDKRTPKDAHKFFAHHPQTDGPFWKLFAENGQPKKAWGVK